MSLIIGSPAKYVQGAGAIKEIGQYASKMGLGDKALVMGGRTALSTTREAIAESLGAQGIAYVIETFRGINTRAEFARLESIGKKNKVNFVVGVGGGKVVDAAKAVSIDLKLPVVIVPTIAATDAACSATATIYSEDHVFLGVDVRSKNPELVLVSTDIIAKAPIRFLVAGIADALSTKFEAEACYKSASKNSHGGTIAQSALAMAQWCTDTIIEHGEEAKKAAEQGILNQTFENVVEAIIYASSVSWENCGLATAHGMQVGFSVLKETMPYLHGELVGFFTLTQLILENQPKELLDRMFKFCHSVGIPVTLAEIGLTDASKQTLMRGVEASSGKGAFVHHEPFPVTSQMLYEALINTDSIGSKL